ncbi:MAG: phosphonate C-P lyase system protein PhnH [Hoeflea sp.]|uniref:phosphonate C-P lyase system protein PhnH n=1 Tax=Hoeflea sp. TaxID=1940281 RepID=UPI001E00F70C|nr:phosphonate C-P lyase system protein PhnH [Hoeflea sp.]MBU4528784.1 phosphonate C-P lyase system protein PhnH [Alphaproteobacteria bacterium]MBU4545889.1 phosphonate C-P lyase system protein PhnH [Alphaproteobacteria bacterium]MBU4549918.1 phosphonate C-P lyase system protein PhnH [Alphaproteobacteria bacterium]MBV1725915.1 phosphonate C-P lyase system protein PhnH [Hoeflea sp.]MBV1762640.1 phosphonate C-P lyase system protein PhnH [Hoeflea sp.]
MAHSTPAASIYEGGFADPVGASQTVFRALMDAMARPGTVHALPAVTAPPAPLTASASALIATLADADTPVWLDPALTKTNAIKDWIVFHTGAPITAYQSEAAFAVVAAPQSLSALNGFSLGTQEFPDRSTSVILQVTTLTEGVALTLEGPGIKDRTTLAPAPMPQHFSEQWMANRQAFPRGIDLILAGPGSVAAMPRSTRLIRKEA